MVLELVPVVTTDCFLLPKKPCVPTNAMSIKLLKKFFVGNFVENFTKI